MPGQPDKSLGIVIVDHGSRLEQSNQMLEELLANSRDDLPTSMPLSSRHTWSSPSPSIATAFDKCMERGARRVIICPFFLGPGKHWTHDIPRLAADAAMNHPGVQFHVAATLGIDDLMLDLLDKRIGQCFEAEPNQFTGAPHNRK